MASTARKTIRRTPPRYCRTHTANTSVSESNPDPDHDSDSDSAWSTDMDTPFVPSSRSSNTPTLRHPAMDTSSDPARTSTRPAQTSTATTIPNPPATPPPPPPPRVRRPADHPTQFFPSWRQMLGHVCLAASLVAFFAFVLTGALAALNVHRGGETPVAEHWDRTVVATTTVTVTAVPAASVAPGASRVFALVPGGLVPHVRKGEEESDVAWSTIWFTGTASTAPAARTKKDAKDKRVLGKLVEDLLDEAEARVKEELPGCTPCV